MSGLCTRRLVWCAVGRRYRLDPEPLEADRGRVATVLAPPEVGRALADVVAGLAAPEEGEPPAAGGEIALVPPGGALLPDLTVAPTGEVDAPTGTPAGRELVVRRPVTARSSAAGASWAADPAVR